MTFNDSPGGIYKSQVIDVVKLYQENGINANLIAFVSIRNYINDRNEIKSLLPKSMVFPLFPKLRFWKLNKFWLIFLNFNSATVVIARNVFAFNLLLGKKIKRLIYDGRGAAHAEQLEYDIYNGTGIENSIYDLELSAVKLSDYRIAVSSKLVDYWVQKFSYVPGREVVIPCTVSNDFNSERNEYKINIIKRDLGIKRNDIVLIYSGSIAEWQSFNALLTTIFNLLHCNQNFKMIFLSKSHNAIKKIKNQFPGRIFQFFVPYEEVPIYLDIAHFGLLIRDHTITNKVSSPVKCAEYLSRGLKIIISSEVGDYSEEIFQNNLGFVIDNKVNIKNLTFNASKRDHQKEYANTYLSKRSKIILKKYLSLTDL